jgi:diguanylate cyclase (GGDEF)-like protein
MRLTRDRALVESRLTAPVGPRTAWVWRGAVVVALVSIFALDRATSAAPVQHLYYLPIIAASTYLGRTAGLSTSVVAVVLYHVANPALLTGRYKEPDLVQIVLFFAVGVLTARLADITRRLHRLATTDDLTGLHNLRSFEAALVAMVRASRRLDRPLAVLVLDVDRLKSLNDTHGHLAGAEAVRTVGHILAERLPPNAIGCRYGGDEFVVGLPGATREEATAVANDLVRAVHETSPLLAGVRFPAATLSISIGVAAMAPGRFAGVAPWPKDDHAAGEALFRAGDEALYVAKNNGRNGVGVASSSRASSARLADRH